MEGHRNGARIVAGEVELGLGVPALSDDILIGQGNALDHFSGVAGRQVQIHTALVTQAVGVLLMSDLDGSRFHGLGHGHVPGHSLRLALFQGQLHGVGNTGLHLDMMHITGSDPISGPGYKMALGSEDLQLEGRPAFAAVAGQAVGLGSGFVIHHIPAGRGGSEGEVHMAAGLQGHFLRLLLRHRFGDIGMDRVGNTQAAFGLGDNIRITATGQRHIAAGRIVAVGHCSHGRIADGPGHTVRGGGHGLGQGIQRQLFAHIAVIAIGSVDAHAFRRASIQHMDVAGAAHPGIVVELQDELLTGSSLEGVGHILIARVLLQGDLFGIDNAGEQQIVLLRQIDHVFAIGFRHKAEYLGFTAFDIHLVQTHFQGRRNGNGHGDGSGIAVLGPHRQDGGTCRHGMDRRCQGVVPAFHREDILIVGFPGQRVQLGGNGLQIGKHIHGGAHHGLNCLPVQDNAGGILSHFQGHGLERIPIRVNRIPVDGAGFQGRRQHIGLLRLCSVMGGDRAVNGLNAQHLTVFAGIGQGIFAGDFGNEIQIVFAVIPEPAFILAQNQRVVGIGGDSDGCLDAIFFIEYPNGGHARLLERQYRIAAGTVLADDDHIGIRAFPGQEHGIQIVSGQKCRVQFHHPVDLAGNLRLAQPDAGGLIGSLGKDEASGLRGAVTVFDMDDGFRAGIQLEFHAGFGVPSALVLIVL